MNFTEEMAEFFFKHIMDLNINGVESFSDEKLSLVCFEKIKEDMIRNGTDEIVEDFAMYLMYLGYLELTAKMEKFMKNEKTTFQKIKAEVLN